MFIVVDTNILVSAFIKPHTSLPALCLDMVFSGKHRLILTEQILEEYRAVLARPKFALDPVFISTFFERLPKYSKPVIPRKHFTLCSDQDDDKFLDAAFAGKSPCLITGNIRHFPKVCSFTQIVTAKQFIDQQDI